MGVNFELSDFPLEVQKRILKKFHEEDQRKSGFLSNTADSEKKTNKYHAEKISVVLANGTEHTFDSKKEYERYTELAFLEKAGEVSNLKMQVPYELIPKQKLSNGKTLRNCVYIADFVYTQDGETVVEDVKGYRGSQAYAIFMIKKKLMKQKYDIEIIEI